MTYATGGLIEATDYNGFANNNANNVNAIYSTGAGDKGYGQTALTSVSAGATVTAIQWANLLNSISTMGNHQGTTLSSITVPVAGNTITYLSTLSTNIDAVTGNRMNATATGTQYAGWTGNSSQTSTTGYGSWPWTITFTHTVTWANATAARYFFNGGGLIKWETSKTSTGTESDDEWNDLANTLVGDIFITAGNGWTQTIAGSSYTGTTKSGGTGTPNILLTTKGFYDLTTANTTIYKQFADTSPYTGQYIQILAKVDSNTSPSVLTLTTEWTDPGGGGVTSPDNISGGVGATAGNLSLTGVTAPTTLVSYFPPSATYLANTWGTATVAASVASPTLTPTYVANASTQNGAAGTTLVINKPTGTTTNDLMVAFASTNRAAGSAVTWTPPAGWTEALDQGTSPGIMVAYKTANASEGSSYTFTASGSFLLAGTIITYRGAAWDTAGSIVGATGTNYLICSAITPSSARNIVIAYGTTITASITLTAPVGFTTRVTNSDATAPSWVLADIGWPNASTGTRTIVMSGTPVAPGGVMVSIKTT